MSLVEVLTESMAMATLAIAALEESGAFRYEGLTLEQWLEARDSYLGQLIDTERAASS